MAVSCDYQMLYATSPPNGMMLLNVSNPRKVFEVSIFRISGIYHLVVAADCRHVFVASGTDGLIIVDVSNPFLP
jgi:hypothetical protein